MAGSWTERERVVAARRRRPAVDLTVQGIERFRVHRTGRNSALVAHYGFVSLFPLLLVFTTVLGFVLEGDPELQQRIIDSVLARVPIIGDTVASHPEELTGSVVALAVGLALALWSGMRAFNVLQSALDDIAEVPLDHRPNLLTVRLRSLGAIAVVGSAQVASAVAAGLISTAGVRWLHRVLLVVAALALNGLILAASYRRLCSARPSWRSVVPGAVFGAFGFTVLQVTGSTIVARAITRASPVYGTFASVIGLITWLSLHSLVALVGAELNGVLPLRRRGGGAATAEPATP